MRLPEPGEHIGWVVYCGTKRDDLVLCTRDYESAMQIAVQRGGVPVQIIAGATGVVNHTVHCWPQPDEPVAAVNRP